MKKMSIEEKMQLYALLAEDIIAHAEKDDGIALNCFAVKLVRIDDIHANEYNPNRMPSTEMGLLNQCIKKFGFLFPVIATWDEKLGKYRIIDGYHRYEDFRRSGRKWCAVLDLGIKYHDAVQLTVLMNRIKGMHQVELMSELVVKLSDLGLEDSEICDNLGMEAEEYLRLKQQLGISHAFRGHEYSSSWEIEK